MTEGGWGGLAAQKLDGRNRGRGFCRWRFRWGKSPAFREEPSARERRG